ncbi:MarR family winged helix-turn-helix transcriptional regulator [Stackebrandtia nassauensis]|uniref:Transcriptional regulator, MarR family n=1 Tax=Stackebrandtia nassauensis (strain DSM 44728 / CIP 108903 / NRRL B-16338 / NBRC 102104 / LLR-40K-21) TaxID=446470 RepID=D3Q099_STANL|nr:MarR family transcriptional regulator [Stackebrandtia nassauensis]ADD45628.1 transcriptional regulator, MarR family [Stackebrandtia nassauensis DSM 44728]
MTSSKRRPAGQDPDLDEAVRALLLLMPRMVGRVKRIPVPEQLRSLELSPRHLSMLALMLFDGPMTVNQLANRLEVAPTTVSLMVSELSRKNVLTRLEDENDRRRRIIDITDATRPDIETWLANGARAWHQALDPLTPEQRRLFIDTLLAYETALERTNAAD